MKILKIMLILSLLGLIIGAASAAECGNSIPCACGDTVNESYTLTGDLDCSLTPSDGLIMNSSNLVIDCDNNSILGNLTLNGIKINGFDNITIKDCNIRNWTTGIYVNDSLGTTIKDSNISDNGAGPTGIHFEYVIDSFILRNNVSANNDDGIYIKYSSGNKIRNNTIKYNLFNGISLFRSNNTTIDLNNITDNGFDGIDTSNIASERGYDNVISNNDILNNSRRGIDVSTDTRLTITDNNISDNSWDGIDLVDDIDTIITKNYINDNGWDGIYGFDSVGTKIVNNYEIHRNGATDDGIEMESADSINVSNNVINNNTEYGIYIWDGFGNHTISGNTLKDNTDEGIDVDTEGPTNISDNIIDCNTSEIIGGSTRGIWVGDITDSYFTNNTITNCKYGIQVFSSSDITMNEATSKNVYGIYFSGSNPGMSISNSEINSNCIGVYAKIGDKITITDTNFDSNNNASIGYDCTNLIEPTTGIYSSGAEINVTNGNLTDNGDLPEKYGINETGSGTINWLVNDDLSCTNNNVTILGTFSIQNDATVTATNCTITAQGNVVNLTAGETGFTNETMSAAANSTDSVGTSDAGFEVNVTAGPGGISGTAGVTSFDSLPAGASGFTETSLGTFIEFNVSAGVNENLSYAIIKIYYTDAEVTAAGLTEDTLFIQYYNATDGTWEIFNEANGNGGVNTTGNYVWANTTHFSGFGLFGVTPTTTTTTTTTTSSSSGGGLPPSGTATSWTGDKLDLTMKLRDSVDFTVSGQNHSIEIISMGIDYVLLKINSNHQITVTANKGESKEVDVNGDGVSDIVVTVNNIISGQAEMSFATVEAAAVVGDEAVEDTEDVAIEDKEEDVTSVADKEAPVLSDEKEAGPPMNAILTVISIIAAIGIGWWMLKGKGSGSNAMKGTGKL